jgi:hypothetical protein
MILDGFPRLILIEFTRAQQVLQAAEHTFQNELGCSHPIIYDLRKQYIPSCAYCLGCKIWVLASPPHSSVYNTGIFFIFFYI